MSLYNAHMDSKGKQRELLAVAWVVEAVLVDQDIQVDSWRPRGMRPYFVITLQNDFEMQ